MRAAERAAAESAAAALKLRVDWSKYPKLAAIFENRPHVNVLWLELARLVREEASRG